MSESTRPEATTPTMDELRAIGFDNAERPFFGLDPVLESWEEVRISDKTTLFYDGNRIRKVIHRDICFFESKVSFFKFQEHDTDSLTDSRKVLLPKTPRGKPKPITSSNVMAIQPSGCILNLSFDSHSSSDAISSCNPKNHQYLPLSEFGPFHTLEDFRKSLSDFIRTCPADYFDKVMRFRNLPHQTVHFLAGNVFRLEMDRKHYCYGLVIAKIHEILKWPEFPATHPLHQTMTQPILYRLYALKTENADMTPQQLESFPLLPACLASDNDIYWGTHPIIGHKLLRAADIDFPLHFSSTISANSPFRVRLAWGAGVLDIAEEDVPKELLKHPGTFNYCRTGVNVSIISTDLERYLRGESPRFLHSDLLHPMNDNGRNDVFRFFGVSKRIDMDGFNLRYGGLTRAQFAERINRMNG